ncbi:hypothetical protein PROFUN_14202 [Planoprotostelium fungivorum]|uniref:Uncharacterized protein n=1 Tax=Planoprotostelium fungivorum TaxID=1890364 RepID=A0A2P6N3A2_9EUKA|nr:hypothetical protein PROFUN_14202 [Planoprotostelium fungivorum]
MQVKEINQVFDAQNTSRRRSRWKARNAIAIVSYLQAQKAKPSVEDYVGPPTMIDVQPKLNLSDDPSIMQTRSLASVLALQMRRITIHTYRRSSVVSLSPLRVDTTGSESISDGSSHKCRPLASNAFVAAVLQTNIKAKMLDLNVFTVLLFCNCLLFCWQFVVVLREEVKKSDQTATPRRKVSKASTRQEKAFKKCSEELREAHKQIKREKQVGCRLHKELLEVKERSETDLKSHLVESDHLRAEVIRIRREKEQVISEHEARAAALTSLTERLQTEKSGLQSALKRRSLEAETECRERGSPAFRKTPKRPLRIKRRRSPIKRGRLRGFRRRPNFSACRQKNSRRCSNPSSAVLTLCRKYLHLRENLLDPWPSPTYREVSQLQEKYNEESSKRSNEVIDHKKEKEKLSQEISQLTAEASVRSPQTAKLEKDLSEMQVKYSSEHLKCFNQATDHRKTTEKIQQELSNVKSQSAKRCTNLLTENGMWKAKHEAAERTIIDLRSTAVVDTAVSTPVQTDPTADMEAEVTNTVVSTPPQTDAPADMEAEVITNTTVSTPTQTDDTADMVAEVIDTSSDMKSAPIDTDSSSEIDMDAEDTDTSIVMDCEQEDTSEDEEAMQPDTDSSGSSQDNSDGSDADNSEDIEEDDTDDSMYVDTEVSHDGQDIPSTAGANTAMSGVEYTDSEDTHTGQKRRREPSVIVVDMEDAPGAIEDISAGEEGAPGASRRCNAM